MNPQYGIIWGILEQLEGALRTGIANVRPQLNFWLTILIAWEVVRIAWHGIRGGIGWPAAECVLRVGCISWAMQYYPDFCERLTNTMVRIGVSVGLGFVDVGTFLDPGAWWQLSDQAAKPLYDAYRGVGFWSGVFGGHMPVLLLVWILYKTAFIAIGVGIFAAQAQALIGTFISFAMLPTLVFRGTQWIGGQVWARAINHSVKLMAWAVVGGFAYNVAKGLSLAGQIDIPGAWNAVGSAWVVTILAFIGQKAAAEALGGVASAGIGAGAKWLMASVGAGITAGTVVGAAGAGGVALGSAGMRVGYSTAMGAVGQVRTGFAAHAVASQAGAVASQAGAVARGMARQFRTDYQAAGQTPFAQRLNRLTARAQAVRLGDQRAPSIGLQGRSIRQLAEMRRLARYGDEGHGGVRQ